MGCWSATVTGLVSSTKRPRDGVLAAVIDLLWRSSRMLENNPIQSPNVSGRKCPTLARCRRSVGK